MVGYELCSALTERELEVAFYETDVKYIGWSQGLLSRTQTFYFWTAYASGLADPLQLY